MPTLLRALRPDGLVPLDYTAESLAEAARHEPDGVYTITNTYEGLRVLTPDAHFDRLEDSARREGIPLRLDRAALRAALRTMVAELGAPSARFRVTVPRAAPDTLLLAVEPFAPLPPAAYREGVCVVTCPELKRHNPAAKTTGWMETRRRCQEQFARGIHEGLLLDEVGNILEGLTSNFYAVVAATLRTAPEGAALGGIAQAAILRLAPAILPVERRAVHVSEVPALDEVFISSSSRGIVPVVELDGVQIGDGAPGPFTRALREAYVAWVDAHLEPL